MKCFIKRFFPFFVTFAAGLLIASFFVTVSAPNFQFKRGEWRNKKSRYLKNENERLRRDNERLQRELAERQAMNSSDDVIFLDAAPPPPMPPMPPEPPKPPVASRR